VNNEDSVVKYLDHQKYQELKDNDQLFAGILPKIDNAFDAIHKGVKEVLIGNSSQLSSLLKGESGTKMSL
jgi:acetylglutamate kinase